MLVMYQTLQQKLNGTYFEPGNAQTEARSTIDYSNCLGLDRVKCYGVKIVKSSSVGKSDHFYLTE